MDTLIYFIFSFAVYIKISDGSYGCDQSIPTIAYVASCPKNKAEWDIAARRKNCESLGAHQNCTKPNSNFQYHCLENQWQNMTLEICAPIFYLQGYCAKYSTDKKRVEENYVNGFECLNFDESEKCPSRYPSTDAYKYQRCYKLKYQNPTRTACPICTLPSQSPQSGTTPIETMEEFGSDTDDSIKTVFLVILALALPGVVLFFILFYKRKSLNLERFCKVLTCDEETLPNNGTKNGENIRHEEQENEVLACDVETGPDNGTVNEENTRHEEQENEVNERSRLLSKETGSDEQATSDKDPALNDSTTLEPISGNNPFEEDTPPSDTEGIMISKSDDHSLSKPKPIDVSLPQVKSDAKNTSKPSKSENEPTDISIPENNKTGDKSRDASKKKFKETLSNSNPAPDSTASKPMSENNPFDEDSTPSATSEKDPALDDSTTLEPNPGNNPFKEDTPPSEFGKSKKAPRPPPRHVTKINVPQHAPLKKKAPPPPRPQGPPKNS